MNRWYQNIGNVKAGLMVIGILIITVVLWFSQSLVNDLRNDNRENVKFYSELIASAVSSEDDESLNFIFENIIKKVRFPIIQTDVDGNPQSWRNLPKKITTPDEVEKYMKRMDQQNPKIPLVFIDKETEDDIIFGYLHYGDSGLIRKLIILPYLEIGAVALFILIGFFSFSSIRNSEKNYIWAGMARETAHQLGTPVSALMGWLDWMKIHPEKSNDVIDEIEIDLERLDQISERFSKMGSTPKKVMLDLSELVESVVVYLRRRLPTSERKLSITNLIDPGIHILANASLLAWALENIIKNGVDSMSGDQGKIQISMDKLEDDVRILIEDNGKGIPRKDWKNIFRPGFSTKKRGWGLGLSLTKRIIQDLHGGKIYIVESVFGKGTTIGILLPQKSG